MTPLWTSLGCLAALYLIGRAFDRYDHNVHQAILTPSRIEHVAPDEYPDDAVWNSSGDAVSGLCPACATRPIKVKGLCQPCHKRLVWRPAGGPGVERDRATSHAAKMRRKTPCPECGALVDYSRPGAICAECKHEAEYGERNRRIVEAWKHGELARVIAAREGMTERAVLALVDAMRRLQGRDDVARRRRRNREEWAYIQRRWNDGGATSRELAAELETTPANVLMMIRTMRDAGVYVARRQSPRKVAA